MSPPLTFHNSCCCYCYLFYLFFFQLTIVEDSKKNGRGVYCHGLNEVEVESVDDVLRILQQVKRDRGSFV
jgi:hypothetical protein